MPKIQTNTRRRSIHHTRLTQPFDTTHSHIAPLTTQESAPSEHPFDPALVISEKLHQLKLDVITRKQVKQLITEICGIKYPSPTLVESIISSMTSRQTVEDPERIHDHLVTEFDGTALPYPASSTHRMRQTPQCFEPRIIPHIPGETDLMFGALDHHTERPSWQINDATVCSSVIRSQIQFMPFRMITARDITEIEGLFDDPEECYKRLSNKFLTTNLGLFRALKECDDYDMDRECSADTMLLGALAKRGGYIDEFTWRHKNVLYPEDMKPIAGERCMYYDPEYWNALFAQGKLWTEMPSLED